MGWPFFSAFFYACCIILFDVSFAKERIASCINPAPPCSPVYSVLYIKITEQVHIYIRQLSRDASLKPSQVIICIRIPYVTRKISIRTPDSYIPGNVSSFLLFSRSSDMSGELQSTSVRIYKVFVFPQLRTYVLRTSTTFHSITARRRIYAVRDRYVRSMDKLVTLCILIML